MQLIQDARQRISIHSLRMEGDLRCDDLVHGVLGISIHSLRMEGDQKPPTKSPTWNISIHSLRMEGDLLS